MQNERDVPDGGEPADPIRMKVAGQKTADGEPVTVHLTVTAQDPEVRTIEAVLALLQLVPDGTRRRVLRYVRDRVEGDPGVWDEPQLRVPDVVKATHEDVARTLATVDGFAWDEMSTSERGAYYRRVVGIETAGMAVYGVAS